MNFTDRLQTFSIADVAFKAEDHIAMDIHVTDLEICYLLYGYIFSVVADKSVPTIYVCNSGVENCLQIVAGGVWFVMDYKGLDDIANGGIYQSRSCGRNGDFVGMIDLTIRKDDEYREVMIL